MTPEDMDADVAREAAAADERFLALQDELIAGLRAEGVPEHEIPDALAYAHAEYWRERCAILERLRVALLREKATP